MWGESGLLLFGFQHTDELWKRPSQERTLLKNNYGSEVMRTLRHT